MLKLYVVLVAAMIATLQPAGAASWSDCMSCASSAADAHSRDRLVVAGMGGMGGGMDSGMMRPDAGGMGGGMGGGGGGMGGGGMGGMGGGGMGGMGGGGWGMGGGADPMGLGGFPRDPHANCPEHRSKQASRHARKNSAKTDSATTQCPDSQY